MDCLLNYIGLKQVSLSPESGIFLNSLPGMSTELADNIANEEQVHYAGVWRDVQSVAFGRFADDVISLLGEEIKINQIVYQTRRPKVYRSQPVILGEAKYRGVYVQVPESKYVSFFLKEVYIFSEAVATTTVKVFDLNDGTELFTLSVNLVLGLNTVAIDRTFSLVKFGGINLFVGFDGSGFSTISFLPEYFNFYDCHNQCYPGSFQGQPDYLVIQPAEIGLSEDVDFDNLTKFSDGRGIAIGAEIQCSIEEFICQNKKSFKQSLLYLLGIGMLSMKLGSSRLNYFSSSNEERTVATRRDFETRYLSSLKKAIESIPLNGDSLCFECSQPDFVSHKYTDV